MITYEEFEALKRKAISSVKGAAELTAKEGGAFLEYLLVNHLLTATIDEFDFDSSNNRVEVLLLIFDETCGTTIEVIITDAGIEFGSSALEYIHKSDSEESDEIMVNIPHESIELSAVDYEMLVLYLMQRVQLRARAFGDRMSDAKRVLIQKKEKRESTDMIESLIEVCKYKIENSKKCLSFLQKIRTIIAET